MIDMDNLDIIYNKSTFTIIKDSDKKSILRSRYQFNHYDCVVEDNIEIKLGVMSIIVSYSNNPQIRGSFFIKNTSSIRDKNGALVYKMYQKDIRLNKLTDIRRLKSSSSRKNPKRIVEECYVNSRGKEFIKHIEIF